MKTLNLIIALMLLAASATFAQNAKKGTMTNTYFVMASHTPEQCLKSSMELKKKGDEFLSKFYFGCHSGDHTCYAFLMGSSEDDVRKMLPKDIQKQAKIQKVDKMTPEEIEKSHKESMKKK